MPHHLLVLAPYAADLASPPAFPASLADAPDYTVTWRPVPVAMSAEGGFADAALEDLALMAAGQHEGEGDFDAVIVDTPGDGGAAALRSVLDLLVLGTGKTAALHALTLGSRVSFLVATRQAAARLRAELRQRGIDAHCASVRVAETNAAALLEAVRRCVTDDGAEAVCLGSPVFSAFASDLAGALDVPLLDPLPLTCELAAALLAAGLRHSRSSAPRPRVPKQAVLAAMAQAVVARP